MKKESFKRTQNKIVQMATKTELNRPPILDTIMGVSQMSETDRIFYEAYKRYGNRDHTWQDFKAMFNGDLKKMRATIKKWRSWNEINAKLSQKYNKVFEKLRVLETNLMEACIHHDLPLDIDKLAKICDTTKHPENQKKYSDLIRVFKPYNSYSKYIDRYIIQKAPKYYSNYKTTHPEIEQIEKQFDQERQKINPKDSGAVKKLLRKYVKKIFNAFKLRNENFIIGERVDTYSKIILGDPTLLHAAQNFSKINIHQKIRFADTILEKISPIHGTPIQTTRFENMILSLLGELGQSLPEDASITLDPLNFDLESFLSVLAHEEAHSIDVFNPNYGLIGTSMMKWINHNYNLFMIPLYKTNPTEVSSYSIDDKIASYLINIIEQNRQNTPNKKVTMWAAFKSRFVTRS